MRVKQWLLAAAMGAAMTWASAPAHSAYAQAPSPPACKDDPKHRELDFWAGEWEVADKTGKKSADVTIAKILNDCGLHEDWRSVRSPNGHGQGLAAYNRLTDKWGYFWISGSGSTTDFDGNLVKPGEMQFVVEQPTAKGTRLRHWTLFALPDGRVRELSLGSDDAGKTWAEEYDLYWTRKVAAKP
jgi:hypothetical protein